MVPTVIKIWYYSEELGTTVLYCTRRIAKLLICYKYFEFLKINSNKEGKTLELKFWLAQQGELR